MFKRNMLLTFILAIGAFGLINTEMGVTGILPFIADKYNISLSKAGSLLSVYALVVAIAGPTMPLLLSGINRKKVIVFILGIFVLSNLVTTFSSNFTIILIARVIPAIFHPVYFSAAYTIAANSVSKEEAPKAITRIIIGVSAGMILGVPVTNFIASTVSFESAMSFFLIVNAIVFIAALLFFPSMPVKVKLTYGEQLGVLKKPILWLAMAAVILFNSAIFGVYTFLAEFLKTITNMSGKTISLMLLVYGGASLIGNIVAGKSLVKNANKLVVSFPISLGIIYFILFLMGKFTIPMAVIIFFWGILAGMATNISQYWITSAAPAASDFANGLFLTSGQLGITIGTTVSGIVITSLGINYVVFVGILASLFSLVFILIRNNYTLNSRKQQSI